MRPAQVKLVEAELLKRVEVLRWQQQLELRGLLLRWGPEHPHLQPSQLAA